jgi:hypothetical protein
MLTVILAYHLGIDKSLLLSIMSKLVLVSTGLPELEPALMLIPAQRRCSTATYVVLCGYHSEQMRSEVLRDSGWAKHVRK